MFTVDWVDDLDDGWTILARRGGGYELRREVLKKAPKPAQGCRFEWSGGGHVGKKGECPLDEPLDEPLDDLAASERSSGRFWAQSADRVCVGG